MSLLYADENFDYPVVEQLRLLGHDVLTVQEAGKAGGADPQVLTDATAANRAVLTFNHRHFRRLHKQFPTHAGIISCKPDPDAQALAQRIHRELTQAAVLAGQFLRIVKPPQPGP